MTVLLIDLCGLFRGRRTSFTPEALFARVTSKIVRSCHEQDNKKIFMSSPACAEGYDTPAQQRQFKNLYGSEGQLREGEGERERER